MTKTEVLAKVTAEFFSGKDAKRRTVPMQAWKMLGDSKHFSYILRRDFAGRWYTTEKRYVSEADTKRTYVSAKDSSGRWYVTDRVYITN